MVRYFKNIIVYCLLKRKFPQSIVYKGSFVDTNSKLGKNSVIFSGVILQNSVVGDYSYIQSKSILTHTEVGKFCSIGSGVQIGLAAHPTSMVSTSPIFYDNTQPLPRFFTKRKNFNNIFSKTVIGSDVWIGVDVKIKSGLNIGTGAVIGAGAVVTKDVLPYSVVVGVPAKHLKFRFKKEIIEQLLDSKWWEFSDKKLERLAPYFENPDVFFTESGTAD